MITETGRVTSLTRFMTWPGDVNGFLLYPSMSLFDSKGKLLFSVKGESEYETFRPVANSDLLEVGRPEERDVDQAVGNVLSYV